MCVYPSMFYLLLWRGREGKGGEGRRREEKGGEGRGGEGKGGDENKKYSVRTGRGLGRVGCPIKRKSKQRGDFPNSYPPGL